jgi:RND family efflux transporter MFP subunit
LALTLAFGCAPTDKPEAGGATTPSAGGATPVANATNLNLPGATPAPGTTSNPPAGAAVAVAIQEVGKENVTLEQTYTAQILAAKEVDVRSQVQGYLMNFSFREGYRVAAGQGLFDIDPRTLQAAVASAEANVQEAEAELAFARNKVNWKKAQADEAAAKANLVNEQREVDRYKPLVERSIIPRQLYDQTVSARDVAKAQYDAAKANTENTGIRDTASIATAEATLAAAQAALDSARVNLSYTSISAPISGVIGELKVYPGNLVSPQDVLATISSTDPIYVEFAISENDYLTIARKREATGQRQSDRIYQLLLADGEPYKYLGKFSMVDRAVDSQTGTIKVRLEFANPSGILRPGEFANVRLNTEDLPDALLIPQRAVQQLQSSNFVYVVKSDNTVEQREIELGQRYQNSVVVSKGLSLGERVVVDGMARLKPGMTVSVQETK